MEVRAAPPAKGKVDASAGEKLDIGFVELKLSEG